MYGLRLYKAELINARAHSDYAKHSDYRILSKWPCFAIIYCDPCNTVFSLHVAGSLLVILTDTAAQIRNYVVNACKDTSAASILIDLDRSCISPKLYYRPGVSRWIYIWKWKNYGGVTLISNLWVSSRMKSRIRWRIYSGDPSSFRFEASRCRVAN
jgi:hypothetical protein